jgi:hypothetical protein
MSGNKHVVLIMGRPNTGKSHSLQFLEQEKLMLLNADLKSLAFNNPKFMGMVDVADPNDILAFVSEIENQAGAEGAILDTLTDLMSMYERMYVAPHAGTKRGQSAWGAYSDFYNSLMHAIKAGSKDYIILAHDQAVYNEETMRTDSKVVVKGAVGKKGVESDLSIIVQSRIVPIKDLQGRTNDMLTITEEEEEDGEKYVFQTRPFKGTGSTCRSPAGMWSRDKLFIDNNAKYVMDTVKAYYGDK